MNTVKVLRLENAEGYGPFAPDNHGLNTPEFAEHVSWSTWLSPSWTLPLGALAPKRGDKTHPHHMLDVLDGHGSDVYGWDSYLPGEWKVGVRDRKQFLHWFPADSLSWFEEKGMRAVTYEVPVGDVRYGTYQLMFRVDRARKVSDQSPVELAKHPVEAEPELLAA